MMINTAELNLITASLRFAAMSHEREAAESQKKFDLIRARDSALFAAACAQLADKLEGKGG